jgi:hypothetical protein
MLRVRSSDRGRAAPPILVLSPDLSQNAVGRALVLVDLIRGSRLVTLAGPFASRPWVSLAGRADVDVAGLPSNPVAAARHVRSEWPGVTIIASKPLLSSFGVALGTGSRRIVLDIDDPELALATANVRTIASVWFRQSNPLITRSLLAMAGRASAVTVSNEVLQARHGGTVIPHARDEAYFDDEVRDRALARRALGLPLEEPLIAFVGTVRSHKGVASLRAAAARLSPAIRLAIVGIEGDRPATNEIHVPPVTYREAMRWVSAADVIVVPQDASPAGRAQAPAKVVDAMAMGRAIVASDLPPIAEMVGDTAVLVAPGAVGALATAIERVLDDVQVRSRLEASTRARFLDRLSFGAVRPSLLGVLDNVDDA